MNVARFASRNARAILLGVVLLTAAGFYSMGSLPSSIYPEVEFPRIVIVAKAGDLSPGLMQLSVTRPLEEAARSVLGVRRVRSKTIRGATEISVLFNPDADMKYALQLMQGKTDEVKGGLPAGTQMQVERMTPSLFPIFMINLTGGIPARDLRDVAEFDLRPLLSRVPGVANVEVLASEEREISVIVDPERLNAARLTIDQVAEALTATNQVNSVGRLAKDYRQYLVLATAQLTALDDVRNVVVAFRQQTPIYVRDVAQVREGVTDPTLLVAGDGKPAALISVARQIHGNIIDVVDGARAAIQGYSASLPPTVRWKVVYDLAEFVKSAVVQRARRHHHRRPARHPGAHGVPARLAHHLHRGHVAAAHAGRHLLDPAAVQRDDRPDVARRPGHRDRSGHRRRDRHRREHPPAPRPRARA